MAQLSFKFLPNDDSIDHETRLLIDGRDWLESIDKDLLGIDPPEFFAQKSLRGSGDLLIGRCGCGVVGCDDLFATVSRSGKEIEWDVVGEKIVFDLNLYNHAIESGASDTSWETVERTAERLVSQIDFSQCLKLGLSFEWASARIGKKKITLSFIKDGKQELFDASWDHKDPKEAVVVAGKLLAKILKT